MKIGFLGGSFDPVHFGHIMAAQDAYERHQLDRVVFVPAARAPLKSGGEHSSPEDRLAMLRAAIGSDRRFDISDFELGRGGVSYTIESARHFRILYPRDELYWIIGGDQLHRLHQWKEIGELAKIIEFIVIDRPGYPGAEQSEIPGLRLHRCEGHLMAISSTELRERVRGGLPVDCFVPNKTIIYIREKGLYRGLG